MLARTKETDMSKSHDPYRLGPMVSLGLTPDDYKPMNCEIRNSVDLCREIKELKSQLRHSEFAVDSLNDLAIDLNNRLKTVMGPTLRRRYNKGDISPPFTPSPRNNLNESSDEYLDWLSDFKGVGGGKKKRSNKRRSNKRRSNKRRNSKRRNSKRRNSKRRTNKRRTPVKRK